MNKYTYLKFLVVGLTILAIYFLTEIEWFSGLAAAFIFLPLAYLGIYNTIKIIKSRRNGKG